MPRSSRSATTVYLDPKVAKAAKIKAAVSDRSLSDLVNEGLLRLLERDERLIQLAKRRRKEPTRPYEEVLEELRAEGLLERRPRTEHRQGAERSSLPLSAPAQPTQLQARDRALARRC
jgi:hypothetical protein